MADSIHDRRQFRAEASGRLRRTVCLAADGRMEEAAGILATMDPNLADDLYRLAVMEGVEPLVLAADPRSGSSSRKERTRAAASRDLVIERILGQLSDALGEADCPVLLEKGAYFRDVLYPSTWMRSMTDLDLLVPPGHRARAVSTLQKAGFKERGRSSRRPFSGRLSLETILFSIGDDLAVEIHEAFTHERRGFQVDLNGIFRRSRATRWPGLQTLRWEDHLLHGVIHLARTGLENRLRHYLDLDRIIRTRELDWTEVARRAETWGCATALYFVLEVVRCLFATPVPDSVLDGITPGGPRVWLLKGLLLDGSNTRGPEGTRVTTAPEGKMARAGWKSVILPLLYDRFLDRMGFIGWMAATRLVDMTMRVISGRR